MPYNKAAQYRYMATENGKMKRRQASRAVYAREPEKRRATVRAWRRKYPIRQLLGIARGRARLSGVAFEIKEQDLLPAPTHCPVLGIQLCYENSSVAANSPSLDRIDPKKGYVAG